jgi:hypothetical protein
MKLKKRDIFLKRFQVELVRTLQSIASKSSDSLPFADLMDSIMDLRWVYLPESEPHP